MGGETPLVSQMARPNYDVIIGLWLRFMMTCTGIMIISNREFCVLRL